MFAPAVRRNVVYEDWTALGSHPSAINEQHIRLFGVRHKIIVDDVYGSGEVLVARKLSDERLNLAGQIDEVIRSKATFQSRAGQ